jgi:hypothetical protein
VAMPTRSVKRDDPLEDFAHREITPDGVAKRVYVAGSGPAVIVMPELPGISPHAARFASWVREPGSRSTCPRSSVAMELCPTLRRGAEVFRRACVSAEFRAFAANASSPVTHWLRARWRAWRTRSAAARASAPLACASPGTSRSR